MCLGIMMTRSQPAASCICWYFNSLDNWSDGVGATTSCLRRRKRSKVPLRMLVRVLKRGRQRWRKASHSWRQLRQMKEMSKTLAALMILGSKTDVLASEVQGAPNTDQISRQDNRPQWHICNILLLSPRHLPVAVTASLDQHLPFCQPQPMVTSNQRTGWCRSLQYGPKVIPSMEMSHKAWKGFQFDVGWQWRNSAA